MKNLTEIIFERLSSGKTISGETLAKELHLTRQALNKHIQILRERKHEIKALPKIGYQLIRAGDSLRKENIAPHLKTKKLGQRILFYESIKSSQEIAKKMAEDPESEGTLITAEEQTSGRGRMGRTWSSGSGGIWFSLILRPKILPEAVITLPLIAAIAWVKVLKTVGISAQIKWPNDIGIATKKSPLRQRTQFLKIGGILTEMSAEINWLKWIVLGIGINVRNTLPKELARISAKLESLTKQDCNRAQLLSAFINALENDLEQFEKSGFAKFRADFLKFSYLQKNDICRFSIAGGKPFNAKFISIDPSGALELEHQDGSKVAYVSGEITLQ